MGVLSLTIFRIHRRHPQCIAMGSIGHAETHLLISTVVQCTNAIILRASVFCCIMEMWL